MRLLARHPAPRRRGAALFAFVLLVLSAPAAGAQETRIALVIGNGAYRDQPLNNPPSDARLIAATLKRLGFTVMGGKPGEPLIDADQKAMKRAIRGFGEQLERAGAEGIGLFFYAGHAVQAGGKNFLIPVGAAIDREADLEIEALSADSVLAQMNYARARVNLVILDACRNNPYRGRFRAATRGLVEMSAPRGSLIAYSTAPGEVAEDGAGTNSPYSAALAAAMAQADVPVELTFKRVRSAVMQATGERQVPWESSSLIGDFYFARALIAAPPVAPPVAPPPQASPVQPSVGVSPRTYKALEVFKDCDGCPEMVALPAGTFTMGSPENEEGRDGDEGPQHEVRITAFAIGKAEVTRGDYAAFVAAAKSPMQDKGCYSWLGNEWKLDPDRHWRSPGFPQTDRDPAVCVSWNDATAYIQWLSQKTGKAYRLPTESEWEYAARAGTKTRYSIGDTITEKDANFGGRLGKTVAVGSYPANPWGLLDAHGNVSEWVEDCYHDSYRGAPADGRAWVEVSCTLREVRGGSWYGIPRFLRSASRDRGQPGGRGNYLGFRVARTFTP